MYCVSTSSLDCFNASIFGFSTNHTGRSIPSGTALTSNEKRLSNYVKAVWPQNVFYNSGSNIGPKVILTDYSGAEQAAL